MIDVHEMTQLELAAYVQTHLSIQGIQVVLSGGAAVSFYSANKYVSKAVDLVNSLMESRKRIREAMQKIGFKETGRHFEHPDSPFIIEFSQRTAFRR